MRSSLLLMMKHFSPRDLISIAVDITVLDLSVYEVSNALWKAVKLLKNIDREEASLIHKTLLVFLRYCAMLRLEDLDHDRIMEIALEKRLTYYDAPYLHTAIVMKLPLSMPFPHSGKAVNALIHISIFEYDTRYIRYKSQIRSTRDEN